MNFLSLLLPFAYIALLFSSLATFSYLYRRRKAQHAARLSPWFPTHESRDIYLSLLELQSKPDTKVPDSILRAALFRRAVEDIHRLISIRNAKPALSTLLQRGSVGDELWQRFLRAEKEMEEELKDVVTEANALAPEQQWGQSIFQSAGEAAHRDVLGQKLRDVEARRDEEVKEWERRKEGMKSEFLKEEGVSDDKGDELEEDGVIVDGETPKRKKKGKK